MVAIIFRTTELFDRTAKKVLPKAVLKTIKAELRADPRKGDVIPGTGGARKVRVALPGRGKSGGARVIYVYIEVRGVIFLLLVYAKSQQEEVTDMQRRAIRSAIADIKEALEDATQGD